MKRIQTLGGLAVFDGPRPPGDSGLRGAELVPVDRDAYSGHYVPLVRIFS